MEVEAKFGVPDEETYERLAAAEDLAGYRLMAGVERELRDAYLDTGDGAVAAAGYTLRRRDWDDMVTVTLKQAASKTAASKRGTPKQAASAKHSDRGASAAGTAADGADVVVVPGGTAHSETALRREEIELDLAADDPAATTGVRQAEPGSDGALPVDLRSDGLVVKALPPGPLRRRLSALVGGRPLQTVVTLAQRRIARDAFDGDRLVAEVSLDTVTVETAVGTHRYHEIEAELRPQATEDDLQTLSRHLSDHWKLTPETQSKFARARALLTADGGPASAGPETRAVAADEPAGGVEPAATVAGVPKKAPAATAAEGPEETPAAEDSKRRRRTPGIEPDDLMSEAARKTVLFHFERMLAHEDGTRAGVDYEELHDMRVATRRMRAALTVFGPYVDEKAYRPHLKSLRRTGRLLGAVRDLDVFHEKAEHYLDELTEDRRGELEPLFDAWRGEREQRRERMIEWLDGGDFRSFVDSFGEFLQERGAGAVPDFSADGSPRSRRVNIALPPVVLTELANVLAYDEWVTGPEVPLTRLHQLRIAGKYLRYTLEFFTEVLGPGGKLVIHTVKGLQDHLGDLQDAVVTSGILRDFLSGEGWGRAAGKRARAEQGTDLIIAPGVANYMAYKQMELARLVRTFPQAWDPVRASRYRHTLLSLLGKL
jgi:CHAD domain-containing protein